MTMHIDIFSSGLDEMKRKDQADPVKILRVLAKCGRYSVFEATDNIVIALTMDRLTSKKYSWQFKDGTAKNYGLLINVTGGQYPWTEIELTEGGKRLLEDNPE